MTCHLGNWKDKHEYENTHNINSSIITLSQNSVKLKFLVFSNILISGNLE